MAWDMATATFECSITDNVATFTVTANEPIWKFRVAYKAYPDWPDDTVYLAYRRIIENISPSTEESFTIINTDYTSSTHYKVFSIVWRSTIPEEDGSYRWRLVEKDPPWCIGKVEGICESYSFDLAAAPSPPTGPTRASNPTPADEAVDVSKDITTFTWEVS